MNWDRNCIEQINIIFTYIIITIINDFAYCCYHYLIIYTLHLNSYQPRYIKIRASWVSSYLFSLQKKQVPKILCPHFRLRKFGNLKDSGESKVPYILKIVHMLRALLWSCTLIDLTHLNHSGLLPENGTAFSCNETVRRHISLIHNELII